MPRDRAQIRFGSADPLAEARQLSEVYDAVLGGQSPPRAPRPLVSESWRRSLAARVDPDHRTPPVIYAPEDLAELRASHPLASVMPLPRDTLVSIADDAMHIMLVTDADGHVLWRDGATRLLTEADWVGLFPGTR